MIRRCFYFDDCRTELRESLLGNLEVGEPGARSAGVTFPLIFHFPGTTFLSLVHNQWNHGSSLFFNQERSSRTSQATFFTTSTLELSPSKGLPNSTTRCWTATQSCIPVGSKRRVVASLCYSLRKSLIFFVNPYGTFSFIRQLQLPHHCSFVGHPADCNVSGEPRGRLKRLNANTKSGSGGRRRTMLQYDSCERWISSALHTAPFTPSPQKACFNLFM